MIEGGYILQPRKIDSSDIMHAPPVVRELWLYLLRKVNHADNCKFKRGEGFFQFENIQNDLAWFVGYRKMTYSKSQLTKSLRRLREGNAIETTKETRGITVTICNYDFYQDPKNYEGNDEGCAKDARKNLVGLTINKNVQEEKNEKKKETDTRFCASEFLLNAGAEKQLVTDWLKVRKEKRLANTETAFSLFLKEVTASGLEINFVLTTCCQRSWGGFKAEWLQKDTGKIKEKPPRLTGRQAYMVEVGNMLEAMEDLKNGIDAGTGSGITGGSCLALPGGGTHRGDA